MVRTMTGPDPREVLIALAATQDYWIRTGQRSVDDAFAVLEPMFWDIVGPCLCEREIYERLSRPLPRRFGRGA